jgi:hypothetical protein
MDTAGIVPEEDMQVVAEEPAAEEVEGSSERLSVFQDFLEKLELDDKEDKENDEDEKRD